MASHVYVVDSSARRHQVKTTPATYLRDVLEEACQKLKKDPNQYCLQDSSRPPKTIDLSVQIRLSGLVSGAKLQLVQQSRSPSVISIALQLPEALGGLRLQDRFSSDTSLWLILRKFEDSAAEGVSKLNITQRGRPSTTSGSGTLEYEQPVVHIMGRDLKTFTDLQKSLMQLGFNSGNVLLRLTFADSGQPMHLAMEEITNYFSAPARMSKSVKDTASTTGATLQDVDVESSAPVAETAIDRPSDIPMAGTPQSDTIMSEARLDDGQSQQDQQHPEQPFVPSAGTPPRPEVSVYKPSSTPTPQAARESYDPDDYVPTVDHAKSHQATLNRAARNQRLLSDAELAEVEQEQQAKLAEIRSSTVRVRLPDQMMIDIVITPEHTPSDMYQLVRDKLETPNEGFQLRHTGVKGAPITLDKDDTHKYLIKDLGFTQRVLVTMVWDVTASQAARKGAVLKASLREQAVELKIPGPVQENGKAVVNSGKGDAIPEKPKSSKMDVEAKMKKFLGFGKKK